METRLLDCQLDLKCCMDITNVRNPTEALYGLDPDLNATKAEKPTGINPCRCIKNVVPEPVNPTKC